MQFLKLASGLALTLALALPASAQVLRGSLDHIDQDSVLGWACYQGDPYTHLPVELWAQNTATLQWSRFGLEYAERERNDVGHSSVCGQPTTSAFFHGFELTVFPEWMIASQGTYQIYAYVYGQPTASWPTAKPSPVRPARAGR